MWQLYDALIEGIPADIKIRNLTEGLLRNLVIADNGGIASRTPFEPQSTLDLCSYKNRPLKELAAQVKSWNFADGCWGMAAINAYYNDESKLQKNGAALFAVGDLTSGDVFDEYLPQLTDKKVAIVGHFDHAIKQLQNHCHLTVLERLPQEGDLPDTAAEFLLGEQEFVFITGMAFTNKSLPRLLQLAQNAQITLVGPSVPMAPILFEFGINTLSGLSICQTSQCQNAVQNKNCAAIYLCGRKVIFSTSYL